VIRVTEYGKEDSMEHSALISFNVIELPPVLFVKNESYEH
jgi:hypothetical protein